MNDKIRLAEAMGWVLEHDGPIRLWTAPNGAKGILTIDLPDPFTDANDDYAVLEWARKQWKGKTTGLVYKDRNSWHKFKLALTVGPFAWRNGTGYQIGDYTRAALKVIGETK